MQSSDVFPDVLPRVELVNGVTMPVLGLGTWQLNNVECEEAVYQAIKIGYRHIDTAQAYGNEADVGRAIKRAIDEGLVTRKELFIATKVSFENDAGLRLHNLVLHQLNQLKVDYIDLYYLHSPLRSETLTRETWAILERLYADGWIRAVGVSNFNDKDLKDLLHITAKHGKEGEGMELRPMVVQNKYDLYHRGRQLDSGGDYIERTCAEMGIHVVGYSPFSSFPFTLLPLHDPLVASIVQRRLPDNVSDDELRSAMAATVLIEWTLRQGITLIPRSKNIKHLQLNFDAAVASFATKSAGTRLTEDEMNLLATVANLVSSPFVVPMFAAAEEH